MRHSRRDFLKSTLAASTALSGLGLAAPAKRAATDWVTLGNSGVKVTRLAFGTGTHGGRVQRELGQEEFTKLVRHAYDHGVRFFETAESYTGMPQMLATALKGIPRDSYRLMTKYRVREGRDTKDVIDQFRRELNTEYFDILLMHCMRSPNWVEETRRVQDVFSDAKDKKIITAHGASVHGLQPLRAFPGTKWLDVALMRMNHNGTRMDSLNQMQRDTDEPGNVPEVVANAQKVRAQGTGLLGMKLCGEGQFTNFADRDAAMKFAFDKGGVNAVTIGYKSTAEIDEAIARMSRVLNA